LDIEIQNAFAVYMHKRRKRQNFSLISDLTSIVYVESGNWQPQLQKFKRRMFEMQLQAGVNPHRGAEQTSRLTIKIGTLLIRSFSSWMFGSPKRDWQSVKSSLDSPFSNELKCASTITK